MMTKNNNTSKRTTLIATMALLTFFIGFMACNQTEESSAIVESGEVLKSNSGTEVYNTVEEMPEYPGGFEQLKAFLSNNIKYPPTAAEEKLEGKAHVKLIIDDTGKVTEVNLASSSGHTILDEEAIRVINSLPNWKPGKHEGKKVSVHFVIPINFQLPSGNDQSPK